jgi:gas vesicle protein
MERKQTNFGAGLVIGAALGAVAAYFFSPKSGKENREMIAKRMEDMKKFINDQEIDKRAKEIYGTVTEESRKAYERLREETSARVGDLNKALDEVDVDKYKKIANDVVESVKKEGGPSELLERGRSYLMGFIAGITGDSEDEKEHVAKNAPKKSTPARKASDDGKKSSKKS